jgi:hypothetical protein
MRTDSLCRTKLGREIHGRESGSRSHILEGYGLRQMVSNKLFDTLHPPNTSSRLSRIGSGPTHLSFFGSGSDGHEVHKGAGQQMRHSIGDLQERILEQARQRIQQRGGGCQTGSRGWQRHTPKRRNTQFMDAITGAMQGEPPTMDQRRRPVRRYGARLARSFDVVAALDASFNQPLFVGIPGRYPSNI